MASRKKKRESGGRSTKSRTSGRTRKSSSAVAKRHAASAGGGGFDTPFKGAFKLFKPAEGKNRVRILPIPATASEDQEHWAIEIWRHFGIGSDNSAYLSKEKMLNKYCPIAEVVRELLADGDDKAADSMKAKRGFLCWIIDRKNEDIGPMLYAMGGPMESDICSQAEDEETGEVLTIDDAEEGYDVIFQRKGTTKNNTRYSGVKVVRNPSPLSDDDDLFDEWLDVIEANPLDKVLNFYPDEHLERVLGGVAARSEDDGLEEEEDDSDPPKTSRSKKKRQREELDDEDDEEEGRFSDPDDEEDGDDLDELDDPDEEDEELAGEEDDEDDEPPRRKKSSVRDKAEKGLKKRKKRG